MNIGIIGGGQLGMMLTLEAIKLGHKVYAIDPNVNGSIKHAGATLLNYSFDDSEGINKLNGLCDVICYEFENIDLEKLVPFQDKLPQGIKALEISRDRILEKEFALSLEIPTPKFVKIDRNFSLNELFYPSILKTTRFGYDGKGQYVINKKEDLDDVSLNQPMILEEKIAFDKEISVIVTKDYFGNIAYYPLIINHHECGILSISKPWWDAPESLKIKAYLYAKKVVETLNYIGTLAIEFFLIGEDLIFNEMAPRPHNSGHFSIEGTTVSQFENMILSITKEIVKTPLKTKESMMINILGQYKSLLNLKTNQETFVHDYLKKQKSFNRKVGHMTLLDSTMQNLEDRYNILKGESMQTRLYIERKDEHQIESQALIQEIKQVLNINISNLRYFVIYDIKGLSNEALDKTLYTVFAEKNKDSIHFDLPLNNLYIAYEYLPGQYDQRADSALQCLQLLVKDSQADIKTGTLIMFEENISSDALEKIKDLLINNVESREKNMNTFEWSLSTEVKGAKIVEDFISFDKNEMKHFHQDAAFAMTLEDLFFVQNYFICENRNPYETELKILDTYWSDHCRHTTFETVLEDIKLKDQTNNVLENALKNYDELRTATKRVENPKTLMDLATINARYERIKGNLNDLEISEEINAASIIVDVNIDDNKEPWLVMFKNETHNHPTEIEPFGGASTCIGGAIRDPLSGRSYVYSASRITGSGDITEPIERTLKGKLPQRVISKKAAEGYASYGNQIGLATTFVQEIYHEGYKAKRMEVGAVIGAAPLKDVVRKTPKPNDLILVIGGRTGRDGIGGATGSSKTHKISSIQTASSEVQKGNAVIERKIQRLFRNPNFTKCVKKSNDFGAGGVSVAIGELAAGVYIELDKLPVKYQGLNPTELAISESQERMAIVIDPKDYEKVVQLCFTENLEVSRVAEVTESPRLVMVYDKQVVCDISRAFIDTAGVRGKQDVILSTDQWENIFTKSYKGENLEEKTISLLTDLNVASQQGMVEMFDSTIGTTTVIMPYGGKYQKTKAQASVQRIPVIDKTTTTVTIMTHGYDPFLSEKNPYLGASYAIIDSIAKTVATGGAYKKIRFTFQEYFERLGNNPETWGKPLKSLLGASKTLKAFELAAIGGKDSMSGSFEDLHVPPTLISFAVSTADIEHIISNTFTKPNSYLYLVKHTPNHLFEPNFESLKTMYDKATKLIHKKMILSAYAISFGGLLEAIIKATFGNRIGVDITTQLDLFSSDYGSILVESKKAIEDEHFILLGKTTLDEIINVNELSMSIEKALAYNESKLNAIYPITHNDTRTLQENSEDKLEVTINESLINQTKAVHVLLPVFPGTNCEYDSARAFKKAGAFVRTLVFNNLSQQSIETSINELAIAMDQTDIVMFSGGFSSGDEPDGSGKFIANVLRHPKISESIKRLRDRKGLILGICNGFQALIKSGLLPYGDIAFIKETDPSLYKNEINRHVSKFVYTKSIPSKSPWLKGMENNVYLVPISHGEGRFIINDEDLDRLIKNHQIAFQYVDENDKPTYDPMFNPNGSSYAIEGIVSEDGLILGKMGHSERLDETLYKNIPNIKTQALFENAVNYIKQRG